MEGGPSLHPTKTAELIGYSNPLEIVQVGRVPEISPLDSYLSDQYITGGVLSALPFLWTAAKYAKSQIEKHKSLKSALNELGKKVNERLGEFAGVDPHTLNKTVAKLYSGIGSKPT